MSNIEELIDSPIGPGSMVYQDRKNSFRNNGLKAVFNKFIPIQTYPGYIRYYRETGEMIVEDIHANGKTRGFGQVRTLALTFAREVDCIASKIMEEHCE